MKQRAKRRYAIQMNLTGPNDGKIFPHCWLPFQCPTAEEAHAYIEKTNPFKRFPEARSLSVEFIW